MPENVLYFPVSWPEIQEIQKDDKPMEAERWFDELEIVKTPDVDVVLLNDITRVIKIEKFFIALYDEMLIVCSRTDSSSFVYSKVGRGPGEYNSLIDVVYDQRNDKILLLTSYPNRILTIDMEGNFISSYTIPGEIDWDRLYMFRNNLFLFGSVFNPKTNISQNVVAKFEGNTLLEPVVITKNDRNMVLADGIGRLEREKEILLQALISGILYFRFLKI